MGSKGLAISPPRHHGCRRRVDAARSARTNNSESGLTIGPCGPSLCYWRLSDWSWSPLRTVSQQRRTPFGSPRPHQIGPAESRERPRRLASCASGWRWYSSLWPSSSDVREIGCVLKDGSYERADALRGASRSRQCCVP